MTSTIRKNCIRLLILLHVCSLVTTKTPSLSSTSTLSTINQQHLTRTNELRGELKENLQLQNDEWNENKKKLLRRKLDEEQEQEQEEEEEEENAGDDLYYNADANGDDLVIEGDGSNEGGGFNFTDIGTIQDKFGDWKNKTMSEVDVILTTNPKAWSKQTWAIAAGILFVLSSFFFCLCKCTTRCCCAGRKKRQSSRYDSYDDDSTSYYRDFS